MQHQFHQQQRPFNTSLQMYTPYNPHRQYGGCCGGRGRGQWVGCGGRGRDRQGGRGRGRHQQQIQQTNNPQYCWSHGACIHTSWFLKNPKEGYQYNATIDMKLDGSTQYCPE